MPFIIGCLALAMPRFAIVLVVLPSDYVGRAYATILRPFVGFLIMPLTTLVYAYAINARGDVSGFAFAVVMVAVLIDLGVIGGSHAARRRRFFSR